ncbi:hypothetical protein EV360DRAFT_83427 [Lentinula raphanica]|nr:hypothetical protein EV360DRAFT_83427 [Lentinula raphanica]
MLSSSSASLRIRSALLLFGLISITRAADRSNPSWLNTVMNDKTGSSSPSPDHEESAHASHEAYGASAYGQPAYGAPTHEYETSSYGQPVYGASTYRYGTSSYDQPAYGESTYGYRTSSYGQRAHEVATHGYGAPGYPHGVATQEYGEPSYGHPVYEAPTYEEPAHEVSTYEEPAHGASTYEAPTHEATVEYQTLAFVDKYRRNTPFINLEIGDEYSFTPVTITKTELRPTKGESSWRALFRYNTKDVLNGRKRIGRVRFPVDVDSKEILNNVEHSIRAGRDEQLWKKDVSKRKDIFIDFLRELKKFEEHGVIMGEEVIDHITVAMDQYEKEWEKRKRGSKGSSSQENNHQGSSSRRGRN